MLRQLHIPDSCRCDHVCIATAKVILSGERMTESSNGLHERRVHRTIHIGPAESRRRPLRNPKHESAMRGPQHQCSVCSSQTLSFASMLLPGLGQGCTFRRITRYFAAGSDRTAGPGAACAGTGCTPRQNVVVLAGNRHDAAPRSHYNGLASGLVSRSRPQQLRSDRIPVRDKTTGAQPRSNH